MRTGIAVGRDKVCISEGVVVAKRADDPLPGFDIRSAEALDLYAMQASIIAHELDGCGGDLD